MSRQRLRRGADNSSIDAYVGNDGALVQASLLASLTASSVSPQTVAFVGVPLTAAASYFSRYLAASVAALHLLIILVANEESPVSIPAVMAGLLGGAILNRHTAGATIFGAVAVAAIFATAVHLEWNLWIVGLPAVVGSVALSLLYLYIVSQRAPRKSKQSNAPADTRPAQRPVQNSNKPMPEQYLLLWV